ncbi:MAG: sigma-54 dependent transcriptional regulator [Acidobacteriaceae bacterium]|jgi:DNA-binding NtrC family response regulator
MGYGLGRENIGNKAAVRTVLLASADADLRARLTQELTAMRWQVREAAGGAEAIALLEAEGAEAMVLDSVLPDLEVDEFASEMRTRHPVMELLRMDGIVDEAGARSPRRNELLHALRQALEDSHRSRGAGESAAWALSPVAVPQISAADRLAPWDRRAAAAEDVAALLRSRNAAWIETSWRTTGMKEDALGTAKQEVVKSEEAGLQTSGPTSIRPAMVGHKTVGPALVAAKRPMQVCLLDEERLELWPRPLPLPEMVGGSSLMLELARLIRLVALHSSTVLIEGETGTGKELVARAVHQLSTRSGKPFVVLNCAAIPESLLEAELFGHTRGAFTGAVQSRTGRIEEAHGGTLFLDEIGEMPLGLQAKMLRFLESGELQRVGDNELVRVDVRVVAATHEPLQQRVDEHAFRLDLYHRLAVFPVAVPALRERMEDVLPLAAHLLGKMGEEMPVKRLSADAAARLLQHDWPGNVRELAHVLERATILAEDRREIAREEVRF